MKAVEIHQVTKTFGQHVAVDDLTLAVPAGTVYGFIGPNGSGKTTTLRMIMRILHPDRGDIVVLGEHRNSAATTRPACSLLRPHCPLPLPTVAFRFILAVSPNPRNAPLKDRLSPVQI